MTQTCASKRKDHLRTQQEGGHVQATERERSQKKPTLLTSSRTATLQEQGGEKILLFKPPSPWHFVMAA